MTVEVTRDSTSSGFRILEGGLSSIWTSFGLWYNNAFIVANIETSHTIYGLFIYSFINGIILSLTFKLDKNY